MGLLSSVLETFVSIRLPINSGTWPGQQMLQVSGDWLSEVCGLDERLDRDDNVYIVGAQSTL